MLLLSKGANINDKNKYRTTAIGTLSSRIYHGAYFNRKYATKVMFALLRRGADVENTELVFGSKWRSLKKELSEWQGLMLLYCINSYRERDPRQHENQDVLGVDASDILGYLQPLFSKK